MGIGAGIFLVAVGAILRYAVTVRTTGIDLHMVGVILMVVGLVDIVLSLFFWSSWGGFGNTTHRRTVVDHQVVQPNPVVYHQQVVEPTPVVYPQQPVVYPQQPVVYRQTVVDRDPPLPL